MASESTVVLDKNPNRLDKQQVRLCMRVNLNMLDGLTNSRPPDIEGCPGAAEAHQD